MRRNKIEKIDPKKAAAIEQLWRLGELSWKLRGKQKDIYRDISGENSKNDTSCVLVSRRFGKSFANCLLATETCIKEDGAIVKYACPKQRMVTTIIKPIMRIILADCPEDMKPEWKSQEKVYRFPNGSEIQVAGTDAGNAETLRGGYAQLLICDEAGFMDDLDYIVNSILLPTTDTTDGRLILTSTPNYKDPQHEFHELFVFPAEADGSLVRYTIYESPMVSPEKIQKIIARYPGGVDNPKFRCEYLCEIPRDTESTVIPEFIKNIDTIVCEIEERPPFYDTYVSMDIGFRDLSVALFAYYDFRNAQIVILDEIVMNGPEMTTDRLAKEIKQKEELYFWDEELNQPKKISLRVMDNDLKLINDLHRLHNISFFPTDKMGKEGAVNTVRMWAHSGRIRIHPRCKHLIYHLSAAQWDKARNKFKHLKDSITGNVQGGHADALDALIYLVRNIMESKNPYPSEYGSLRGSNVFKGGRPEKEDGTLVEFMKSVMNLNKKG